MSKHTPAPWFIVRNEIQDRSSGETPELIATISIHSKQEQEANTRLISAAPELLAATTRMLNWLEGRSDEIDIIDMALEARAAINKAKGE